MCSTGRGRTHPGGGGGGGGGGGKGVGRMGRHVSSSSAYNVLIMMAHGLCLQVLHKDSSGRCIAKCFMHQNRFCSDHGKPWPCSQATVPAFQLHNAGCRLCFIWNKLVSFPGCLLNKGENLGPRLGIDMLTSLGLL